VCACVFFPSRGCRSIFMKVGGGGGALVLTHSRSATSRDSTQAASSLSEAPDRSVCLGVYCSPPGGLSGFCCSSTFPSSPSKSLYSSSLCTRLRNAVEVKFAVIRSVVLYLHHHHHHPPLSLPHLVGAAAVPLVHRADPRRRTKPSAPPLRRTRKEGNEKKKNNLHALLTGTFSASSPFPLSLVDAVVVTCPVLDLLQIAVCSLYYYLVG
jgi:hypothetical protein